MRFQTSKQLGAAGAVFTAACLLILCLFEILSCDVDLYFCFLNGFCGFVIVFLVFMDGSIYSFRIGIQCFHIPGNFLRVFDIFFMSFLLNFCN